AMINGGFFVLNPSVIDLIDNDATTIDLTGANPVPPARKIIGLSLSRIKNVPQGPSMRIRVFSCNSPKMRELI
ncbi:hypothetical protein GFJ91_24115, partial [Salmonella enterica subsp. enterica serovar Enteritidis]|nr:hypothetical protein [Salmonella enterica subsp. enterica serovar Enteritidis]